MPLRVNEARLWASLMASAEIGPGEAGGLARLALGDADKAMRDRFGEWCSDAGLALRVDAAGNMFARYPGREALPPVLVGSHLDTQITGGRFDGILGVLAGLECVRRLAEEGIVPRRPIEVVNWTNEEGARFSPPMMASAVFAGLQDLAWLYARTDASGRTVEAELRRIGYLGAAPVGFPIDAYFELHIEQGPELDARGQKVGIVTGGYTALGMNLRFVGETAHTGPTPMDRRRDAAVAAAHLAIAVNEIGWQYAPLGKSTTSRIDLWPNLPGLLSARADVTFDVRHPDRATAAAMFERGRMAAAAAAAKARCTVDELETWRFGDEVFDAELIEGLAAAAAALDIEPVMMLSQAGHDAYYVSRVAPTAMLFCPCKDGITHNEAESCSLDDIVPAANVLLNALVARADRA
ncbi:MAG: hydantoinase/carbamoylase family amidase [Geminicoccaceae bacterium]|nr:MAG: hydantoinase/carbamoylase family amidase [Geminicoccaceae bacterium]